MKMEAYLLSFYNAVKALGHRRTQHSAGFFSTTANNLYTTLLAGVLIKDYSQEMGQTGLL